MFEAKQTAIEQFILDNLTDLSAEQIIFENMKSPNPDQYAEWVRFSVLFGESKRMQVGGNGYRHPGIITAQIFLREGVGVNRGVELADIISNMFRDQIVNGVNLWVPSVIKVPVSDAGWFQVQVTTPFYFDEVN